jgi:hypothetical protein
LVLTLEFLLFVSGGINLFTLFVRICQRIILFWFVRVWSNTLCLLHSYFASLLLKFLAVKSKYLSSYCVSIALLNLIWPKLTISHKFLTKMQFDFKGSIFWLNILLFFIEVIILQHAFSPSIFSSIVLTLSIRLSHFYNPNS